MDYFFYSAKEKINLKKIENLKHVSPNQEGIRAFTDFKSAGLSEPEIVEETNNGTFIIDISRHHFMKMDAQEYPLRLWSYFVTMDEKHDFVLNDEIILSFGKDADEINIDEWLAEYGCKLKEKIDEFYVAKIDLDWISEDINLEDYPLLLANKINAREEIQYAYPNALIRFRIPSVESGFRRKDIGYYKYQWHLNNTGQFSTNDKIDIKVEEGWKEAGNKGNGIMVAVLDGGFDMPHSSLAGKSTAYNADDPTNDEVSGGNDSHGNACAGLIGASIRKLGNEYLCMGVVPECHLFLVKCSGLTDSATLVKDVFSKIIQEKIKIVSYSGDLLKLTHLENYFNTIYEKHSVLLVSTTGNGRGSVEFPACIDSVLGVGAVTCLGKAASYSKTGKGLDVVAPSSGENESGNTIYIETIDERECIRRNGCEDRYKMAGNSSGFGQTSAAAPIAAGVCALILAVNPDLSAKEIKKIICDTASTTELDNFNRDNSRDDRYGFGLVNARDAAKKAMETLNNPV